MTRRYLCSALLLILPACLSAQNATDLPGVAPSSFTTTEVRFTGRYSEGKWNRNAAITSGAARFAIAYGQPHARGRQILGDVVPTGVLWRLGANLPTTLTTDVDLMLGGARIPHGVYSVWAIPGESEWTLIVNKEVGQFGTDYTKAADLARIKVKSQTLLEPIESLTITIIPNLAKPNAPPPNPSGVLRIMWGTFMLSVPWEMAHWEPPGGER